MAVIEVGFCGKLVGAALFDKMKALVHLFLKAHVEHAVRFVNYQVLELVEEDGLGVFEMVQESTRRANEHGAALAQTRLFLLWIFSSHDGGADDEMEELQQLLELDINLHT